MYVGSAVVLISSPWWVGSRWCSAVIWAGVPVFICTRYGYSGGAREVPCWCAEGVADSLVPTYG